MADSILRPLELSQNLYPDPQGGPDSAHSTDCGETCVAAGVPAFGRLELAPGCYRQALGNGPGDGATIPSELRALIRGMGLMSESHSESPAALREAIATLCAPPPPYYFIAAIGYFQGPNELHWILFYDGRPLRGAWAMDPWTGHYRFLSNRDIHNQATGDYVTMHRHMAHGGDGGGSIIV